MKDKILRRLFLGFIQVHILRHANQKPFYGAWLIEHLKDHGYKISPGTVYPLLHKMEEDGLIDKEISVVKGRQRKLYSITALGKEVLDEADNKIQELARKKDD